MRYALANGTVYTGKLDAGGRLERTEGAAVLVDGDRVLLSAQRAMRRA